MLSSPSSHTSFNPVPLKMEDAAAWLAKNPQIKEALKQARGDTVLQAALLQALADPNLLKELARAGGNQSAQKTILGKYIKALLARVSVKGGALKGFSRDQLLSYLNILGEDGLAALLNGDNAAMQRTTAHTTASLLAAGADESLSPEALEAIIKSYIDNAIKNGWLADPSDVTANTELGIPPEQDKGMADPLIQEIKDAFKMDDRDAFHLAAVIESEGFKSLDAYAKSDKNWSGVAASASDPTQIDPRATNLINQLSVVATAQTNRSIPGTPITSAELATRLIDTVKAVAGMSASTPAGQATTHASANDHMTGHYAPQGTPANQTSKTGGAAAANAHVPNLGPKPSF